VVRHGRFRAWRQTNCLTHPSHERNGLQAQQGFTEVDRGPIYD